MSSQRDHGAMESRRLRAAKLFESGKTTGEVARLLGVRRQSAYKWKMRWKEDGKIGLHSKGPAGPKSRLTEEQCDSFKAELLAGPEARVYAKALWTLPRVAKLIEDRFGIRYHPAHVWKLLRSFGFSCQQPTRHAIERDAAAITKWKQRERPALKKPAPKA